MKTVSKTRRNLLRTVCSLLLIALIVGLLIYFPFFLPKVKFSEIVPDFSGKEWEYVAVSIRGGGNSGVGTADTEVVQQWCDFLNDAYCKPFRRKAAWDVKPSRVVLVAKDGTVLRFSFWPDFLQGSYLYRFDDSSKAEELFQLVYGNEEIETFSVDVVTGEIEEPYSPSPAPEHKHMIPSLIS